MPKDNSSVAKDLADQYLKLLSDQKALQSQIEEQKQKMAKYCQKNEVDELVTGNTRLKVVSGEHTVFPKAEEAGRREVIDIMYKSPEYKYSVTFDIVKLGLAYDKNQLSQDLKDKLKPFTKTEPFIRITSAKLKYE
jgi:hypothetical protein